VTRAAPPKLKAETLLASHGLRVTEQRLALLRAMLALTKPVSHPELAELLARSGLDRATVYRNLLTLTAQGVLVRVSMGDQVWRYELRRDAAHSAAPHAHLVCNDCGEIECLPKGALTLSAATRGRIVEVQLRGQCLDCAA